MYIIWLYSLALAACIGFGTLFSSFFRAFGFEMCYCCCWISFFFTSLAVKPNQLIYWNLDRRCCWWVCVCVVFFCFAGVDWKGYTDAYLIFEKLRLNEVEKHFYLKFQSDSNWLWAIFDEKHDTYIKRNTIRTNEEKNQHTASHIQT